MGICSSCLSDCFGHSPSSERDATTRPLLSPAPQYNTFYPPSPSAVAIEPSQEREYLDRIVAQTSEHLIDIFAPPVLAMSVTPSSRGEWYRSVLERCEGAAGEGEGAAVIVGEPGEVGREERRWLGDVLRRGEEAVKEVAKVRSVGALVVGLDMDY